MKVLKYFSIFFISFSISSCNMLKKDEIPYELKDTWGENGDWSNNKQDNKKQVSKNDNKKEVKPKVEEVKKEEVKEEPKKEETKEELKKEEVKKEEPVNEENKVQENKEEIAKKELNTETEQTKFKDDKLSVALDVSSWQEKESISKIKLFSKNIENDQVILSLANLKGLNDKLLDKSFKDKYIGFLQNKLKDFQLVSNSEENYSNKKAWTITYLSSKNNIKVQQKQIFIPKNNSTVIVNIVSNEETMFKSDQDISKTLSTLEVY